MRSRRRIPLIVALAATLALAGVAFAFLTAPGSGAGSGTSDATALDVTLAPATASDALFPGGDADVTLTVSNPNISPTHLNSLDIDSGGITVDSGHSGCSASSLHWNGVQDNTDAGWDLLVSDGTTNGSTPITLPDAIHMDTDAANDCQGAQFTVYLKAGS